MSNLDDIDDSKDNQDCDKAESTVDKTSLDPSASLPTWMVKGRLVEAKDTYGNWYPAKVVQVQDSQVHIHFQNWSSRYDTWFTLPDDSGSIRLAAAVGGGGNNKKRPRRASFTTNTASQDDDFNTALVPSASNQSTPPFSTGSYVMSEWRNKAIYLAEVLSSRPTSGSTGGGGGGGGYDYLLRYVWDHVVEWTAGSKIYKAKAGEVAEVLAFCRQHGGVGAGKSSASDNKASTKRRWRDRRDRRPSTSAKSEGRHHQRDQGEDWLVYDQGIRQFNQACRQRRERQRSTGLLTSVSSTSTIAAAVSTTCSPSVVVSTSPSQTITVTVATTMTPLASVTTDVVNKISPSTLGAVKRGGRKVSADSSPQKSPTLSPPSLRRSPIPRVKIRFKSDNQSPQSTSMSPSPTPTQSILGTSPSVISAITSLSTTSKASADLSPAPAKPSRKLTSSSTTVNLSRQTGVVNFPCPYCTRKLRNAKLLATHLSNYHKQSKAMTVDPAGIDNSSLFTFQPCNSTIGSMSTSMKSSNGDVNKIESTNQQRVPRSDRRLLVSCIRCNCRQSVMEVARSTSPLIQCSYCLTWSHKLCYSLSPSTCLTSFLCDGCRRHRDSKSTCDSLPLFNRLLTILNSTPQLTRLIKSGWSRLRDVENLQTVSSDSDATTAVGLVVDHPTNLDDVNLLQLPHVVESGSGDRSSSGDLLNSSRELERMVAELTSDKNLTAFFSDMIGSMTPVKISLPPTNFVASTAENIAPLSCESTVTVPTVSLGTDWNCFSGHTSPPSVNSNQTIGGLMQHLTATDDSLAFLSDPGPDMTSPPCNKQSQVLAETTVHDQSAAAATLQSSILTSSPPPVITSHTTAIHTPINDDDLLAMLGRWPHSPFTTPTKSLASSSTLPGLSSPPTLKLGSTRPSSPIGTDAVIEEGAATISSGSIDLLESLHHHPLISPLTALGNLISSSANSASNTRPSSPISTDPDSTRGGSDQRSDKIPFNSSIDVPMSDTGMGDQVLIVDSNSCHGASSTVSSSSYQTPPIATLTSTAASSIPIDLADWLRQLDSPLKSLPLPTTMSGPVHSNALPSLSSSSDPHQVKPPPLESIKLPSSSSLTANIESEILTPLEVQLDSLDRQLAGIELDLDDHLKTTSMSSSTIDDGSLRQLVTQLQALNSKCVEDYLGDVNLSSLVIMAQNLIRQSCRE